MSSRITEIFDDKALVDKIKRRLPYLFQMAEVECSRAGTTGMQVGSLRENIIIALLIYKFGEEGVNTNFPITKSQIDVELFGKPISIKTISRKVFTGVKLSWTVDAESAREFRDSYYPQCDIMFVQIVWNNTGGLYYIPSETQQKVINEIGKEKYIKLPKPGTNPRGADITKEALKYLVNDRDTRSIEIFWEKAQMDYSPYKRWIDYWRSE